MQFRPFSLSLSLLIAGLAGVAAGQQAEIAPTAQQIGRWQALQVGGGLIDELSPPPSRSLVRLIYLLDTVTGELLACDVPQYLCSSIDRPLLSGATTPGRFAFAMRDYGYGMQVFESHLYIAVIDTTTAKFRLCVVTHRKKLDDLRGRCQ